jgi:hypothetical protein
MKKTIIFFMKTKLVASLSILALIIGVIGMTSSHFAEAKGMPIHNPNWADIVANPTSQNGHAPASSDTVKAITPTNTAVITKTTTQIQKNKDTLTTPDNIKTKPQQQKINQEIQVKSESVKIASDKAKANALIKANTHNLDIKVNQKPKQ